MMIRSESGFTLVECMISMMIFAVGFTAIITMQTMSTKINVKSRGMTEAVVVSQNKIEELSGRLYTHPDLVDLVTGAGAGAAGLNVFPATAGDANNADHTDASNPRYIVYWNVQDNAPYVDTKTIRVIVRWSEKDVFFNFPIDYVKAKGV